MPHTWWNFEIDFSLDNHQTSSGYESEYVIRVLRFLQNKQTKTPPQSPDVQWSSTTWLKKCEDRRFQTEGCRLQTAAFILDEHRAGAQIFNSFFSPPWLHFQIFFWPTFNCHEMIIWNLGVNLELFATLVLFWLLWYTWNSNDLFVVWEASTFHCIGLIFEKYGSACSF